MEVLDDVARTARLHNAVGDGDRVDAVAIGALVGAAILGARDVELDDAGLDFGAGGRGHQLVVACRVNDMQSQPEACLGD